MIEYQQVLSLVITASMYAYLLWLVRNFNIRFSKSWSLSIAFIVMGEFFAIIERVVFEGFFNFMEHFSFMMACLIFFISVYNMKRPNG